MSKVKLAATFTAISTLATLAALATGQLLWEERLTGIGNKK